MVRPGWKEAQLKEVLSELGIFGYVIGDKNSISHNKQVRISTDHSCGST